MKNRFRPSIEQVEDRVTPSATPFDVYAATFQIQLNTKLLQFVTDRDLVNNGFTQPFVGEFLDQVHQSNTAAINTINAHINDIFSQHAGNPLTAGFFVDHVVMMGNHINEATMGIGYAQSFAAVMNTPLTPVSPPGPPPTSTGEPSMFLPPPVGPAFDLGTDHGMVAIKPNTTTSAFTNIGNGVRIRDIVVGDGAAATSASTVTVFYTGWLDTNGNVFDSRRSPSAPIPFALSGTIDGFEAGVIGMKPGGIRQIFIPSAQGYGGAGSPSGSVPPNTDIVFEVKLISTT